MCCLYLYENTDSMFLSINNNTCLLAFIRKNVAVQNFRKAVVVLFFCISTAVMMMMKSTTKIRYLLLQSYFLHVNELKRLNLLTELCYVLYVLQHQAHGVGLGVARLSELEIMIDIKIDN